jgi:hypothetical protein
MWCTWTKNRISALILVGIWSSLLFVSNDLGTAFAKTKLVSIQGEGFGNNGMRFKSFVDCNNQQHKLFDGGSHTNFTVNLSNTAMSKSGIGTWNIEYKSGELSNFNLLSKGGIIINGKINGSHYSLTGLETVDTVCGGQPTPIILTGDCGENKAVNYQFANGQKTGSTVPPNGGQVYYLFGSDVRCTVDSSNNQ